MAVAPALRGVHRVGGEDAVEHVGRVDLRAVFVFVSVERCRKTTQKERVEEGKGERKGIR